MNTVMDIRKRMDEVLRQERQKVADATADDWHGHELGLLEGWVEGLECAIGIIDEAIPTVVEWGRIQDEAIIGLHMVAIKQLTGGNIDEAIGILTRTINQLRDEKGDEE